VHGYSRTWKCTPTCRRTPTSSVQSVNAYGPQLSSFTAQIEQCARTFSSASLTAVDAVNNLQEFWAAHNGQECSGLPHDNTPDTANDKSRVTVF
jgi:hypothetical protein